MARIHLIAFAIIALGFCAFLRGDEVPIVPATSRATAESVFKVPNILFTGRSRPNEFLIGIDPGTKRTANSAPAGYIKSLLPKFLPNDQTPAMRFYKAAYEDLHGKRVRVSGWLKTKDVEQWCGLRIFVFGKDNRVILDDDMRTRPIHGTTDWAEHQIVVDVPADADSIGVLSFLYGKGEVWSDDLQLQAVGPEVALTDDQPWKPFSFFAANYTAAADPQVAHDGHPAICIASAPEATTKQWISYDHDELTIEKFRGRQIKVTIWMKSSTVTGGSGVWINVFGPAGKLASDGQVGHRPLRGTTDWKAYTAIVDVPNEATSLAWGIVMNGTGKVWMDADGAQCVVDDAPAR